MPKKKHHIRLSPEERAQLETILRKGKANAHCQRHTRILLLADCDGPEGGWSDPQMARAAHTSIPTAERVRRIWVEHGLERALERKDPERVHERKFDGKAEAVLIALCCGEPAESQARWTLRLLAGRLVELEVVDSISHETVRQTLKKRVQAVAKKAVGDRAGFKRGICRRDGGRARRLSPPTRSGAPLVCLDECTKQLTRAVRPPLAAAPGQPAREDYEYHRNGVAAIFCAVMPHLGWRRIEAREQKTRRDYAHFLRTLVEVHFPSAEKIVLVQDNLNTHSPASLYEAFPPAEAARLKARFEFHFTPKHGSWMNIAEIELSVLSRGCLACRIPDRATLAQKLAAWQRHRNQSPTPIRWHFTTAGARIKLRKLYPSLND